MTELSDHFVNLRLAAGFKTTLSVMSNTTFRFQGFHHTIPIEWPWWLKMILPSAGRSHSPLTVGMKTEDTILKALKKGEIEMLDSIWKRVKNNRSLSKLREVGIREAMVRVAQATGQEHHKFEDHTPYSNQGMEDLLKLNKVASAIKAEIILP